MRRLATFAVDHRRRVLLIWIVILVGVGAAAGSAGSKYSNDFQLPDTDSTRALDLLKDRFPAQSGDTAQIVYHSSNGPVTEHRQAIVTSLKKIYSSEGSHLPHVTGIVPPNPKTGAQISKDGTIAFATVNFDKFSGDIDVDDLRKVISVAQTARGNGLEVELGGNPIEQVRFQDQGQGSEFFGIFAAIIVLLITFGSLVAMSMPILTAVIALGTALSLVGLFTHVTNVADFAPQLAAMIGLGVGIDYALFILTRYRSELGTGREPREAIINAMDTAGRAVLFAGITVVIAMLGMMLLGVSFLYGPAIAASLAVLFTMLAALTLLPAMLGFVGNRIDRLRLPFMKPKPRVEDPNGRWARWARFVGRHPLPTAAVSLLFLVVLMIPVLSLDLGSADAGTDPTGTTTRKAYDLLAEGFGPGFNGTLLITAERGEGPDAASTRQIGGVLSDELNSERGIANVEPPRPSPDGDVIVIQAFPSTSPQDQATEDLVQRIRSDIAPVVERDTGATVHVGGITAIGTDFAKVLTAKLPLFVGVVVLLSALLLMAVFRSVLVPLKAVAMNLISIAASFGIVVAIFQKGWGAGLIGIDTTAPIEPFLPVMVFAIIFGLSMDYEVFLMSRIHEEWERRGEAKEAVVAGLAATGRVITAAATIMTLVFVGFVLGDDRVIKLFGIGLASAVLIDAIVIRSILVPAVMVLMGKRAWWIPAWLDRLLPNLNVEPPESPEGGEAAAATTS